MRRPKLNLRSTSECSRGHSHCGLAFAKSRKPDIATIFVDKFFAVDRENKEAQVFLHPGKKTSPPTLGSRGAEKLFLPSRLYREGACHAATTPAIYCHPTVVGLHHANYLPVLPSECAFNPNLSPPGARRRAAHFRMRTVWQANRPDRSSIVGIRTFVVGPRDNT